MKPRLKYLDSRRLTAQQTELIATGLIAFGALTILAALWFGDRLFG